MPGESRSGGLIRAAKLRRYCLRNTCQKERNTTAGNLMRR